MANVPWSDQSSKREGRDKRKQKKERKKEWQKSQGVQSQTAGGSSKRSRSPAEHSDGTGDDWAELAEEERMAKKLRKGEIAQSEFDRKFADL